MNPFLKKLVSIANKAILVSLLLSIPFFSTSQCATPPDQTFGSYTDLSYNSSLTYDCITYTGASSTDVYVGIGNAVANSFTKSPLFSGSAVGIGNNGPGGGGYAELRSVNGNQFAMVSVIAEFYGHNNGSCSQLYSVVGYRDNNEVVRVNNVNITASTVAGSGTNTIVWTRNSYNTENNNSGTLTFGQGWGNVDMIRFYALEAAPYDNFFIVLDNIDFSPASALPVTFGSIGASLSGDQLLVNWNTLSETNNDHFSVQLSGDGENFVTVATVKSKSATGNSDVQLSYNLTIDTTRSQWLISCAGIILLLLSLSRRKKLLSAIFIVAASCLFYGCSKSNPGAADLNSATYVRIAQIDKDGMTSYSKVVKVTIKN